MAEKMQVDALQSRQALIVRCCLRGKGLTQFGMLKNYRLNKPASIKYKTQKLSFI